MAGCGLWVWGSHGLLWASALAGPRLSGSWGRRSSKVPRAKDWAAVLCSCFPQAGSSPWDAEFGSRKALSWNLEVAGGYEEIQTLGGNFP